MNRLVSSPRKIAFDVLLAVEDDDAYANLLLPSKLNSAQLSSSDAAFATELAYNTLRMQGFYDAVISNAAQRDIENIDTPLLVILRLGTHQLLNMRVPPHAAVNESVKLAQKFVSQSSSGFINAVLRRIERHDLKDWQDFLTRDVSDHSEKLSILYSHPTWIIRAFKSALEADNRHDELEDLLGSNNVNPLVTFIRMPGEDEQYPDGARSTSYSPYGFTIPGGGDPRFIPGVAEGVVRVQDEGSQLAGLLLSQISGGENSRWLDMCAGPGGKAALLAATSRDQHSTLTANEIVPARVGLVEDALGPYRNVSITNDDGRIFSSEHPNSFQRVLLDAPCTGLGALRRRPEARWRKQPADVPELTKLQEELLVSSVESCEPGGVVAYVTCSPHIAETRGVLNNVIRKRSDVIELDAREYLEKISLEPLNITGSHLSAQLWPHAHGTDAMFISLLRKSL
jgi:16S rRNA (cytosine967-C5)-methyltransferase